LKKQNKDILYKLEKVSFSYDLGAQKVKALQGVSLNIPEKALVTLSGPSGSGKSTLLNVLGLIEPVQEGEAFFQNECLSKMTECRKTEIRKRKVGFIFQHFHLIPVLTAEENVSYFLYRQGLSKEEIEKRTREALQSVSLWDHRKKLPSQLSGGQKQRVAIARALAKKPEVIIGDEPTASLDQQTGREIIEIFVKLVKEEKVTVILTTHDPMVQSYADINFHLRDGKLEGK